MDFEFTSRPNTRPLWAQPGGGEPSTPRKRTQDDLNAPPSPFAPRPPQPSFGANQSVPFLFQSPQMPAPQPNYPWAPPSGFSPTKAFPQPEIPEVTMGEASPEVPRPKPAVSDDVKDNIEGDGPVEGDSKTDERRVVALGGLKRVFKKRQAALARTRRREALSEGETDGSSEEEGEERGMKTVTKKMTNHYTLNMPGVSGQGDLPYLLLGYLQFFFNLSLVLVFLYLLIQFILTVQRDVEHRISEYSMDVIQDIAHCALQFRTNLCDANPVPAMAHQCASWKTCMDRDPTKVGRAKVGAELIAEVVNGFVEPISWKTLAFTLTSLSFLTVFINTLLSLYRSKHAHSSVTAAISPQHHPSLTGFPPQVGYAQPHFAVAPAAPHTWPKGDINEGWEARPRRRRLK
ncbi:hypothetical protein PUNSTDRAFT_117117 [Punctularia strigosozonata HHB-11173 SS5]|uniref:uncharacterized protein n=1 Tax=Punctularia strigosozonata (strain HHB-11173) TaxID=741275 RepID=UPI0004416250|nr:uncharacterized protein PUNSTDRAFT_117117 [Punctularia strigosozonata HHB-11173 SS5]EIN13251.1 hypothetical protein PUNSTDRAFT_117117 [Punctularia strigosozonata HHB-11173 SS5]